MDKFDRWDIPGIAGTIMSTIALLRGQAPEVPTRGPEGDARQKTVSSFKAMLGKEDEGMWVSLMATLKVPEQDAITLVLEKLTGVNEVDSFRLAIVNAPNATHTEETRDPDKPKVVVKKVVKATEYCDEDNRVKLLKNIAARSTDAAVIFVRTHHLAVENSVTKYGPALLDQLTANISAGRQDNWRDTLRSIPIALWIIGGSTVLLLIGIVIKIQFFD